jgi:nucleoside 2-deoxyribosyltransferase
MKLKCFVIMPYASDFDAIYAEVKRNAECAVPGTEIDCFHLRDVRAAGKITDDIIASLREAAFCIADVTGNNPNVMWETGYAMALGKPTILIGQDIGKLPFDLKIHRILSYCPSSLNELSEDLIKAIQQTLAKYEIKVDYNALERVKSSSTVIAVTGSTTADPIRVRRRIETFLSPYLARDTIWYCGSVGIVDETAIDYLSNKKQYVITVAYNRYDFTDISRRLVRERKIPFIDASVESLPNQLTGPSSRDIFFTTKVDLIVLFWDGRSQGTQELIHYFEQQGKNILVGFI